jgi:hypothetical protein
VNLKFKNRGLLVRPCRSGTGANDTVLALGVDETVLTASKMSQKVVEESVRSCGGVLVQVGVRERLHCACCSLLYAVHAYLHA